MSINVTKKIKCALAVKKINDKLNNCGWYEPLKEYLDSANFLSMIDLLYTESSSGNYFTPSLANVFNAFEYCPFDKLKCIILAPGPYSKIGVADGLAFSCGKTMVMEKDLQIIYKSIDKTTKIIKNHSPSLKKWSEQGVLLLNASLTTKVGIMHAHHHIWEEFIKFLLHKINKSKVGIPTVFIGKYTHLFESCVSPRHFKILVDNPINEYYSKNIWEHKDLWNKVNENLVAQNKQKIIW